MCGITGCIVRSNEKEASSIYSNLVKASDIRGQDGTGITLLRNGEFITKKWNARAKDIPFNIELEVGDIIIGQNRYSIFGLDEINHQPIVIDNLSLVHNGVLYNFSEQSRFLETTYNINRSLEVDSELIVRVLSLLLSTNLEKDALKRVLHILDGEMSCLCINKETRKLYVFMKNKILFSGEDVFGNVYFFSTLYIKNKVPEIFQNVKEYHNYDIEIF